MEKRRHSRMMLGQFWLSMHISFVAVTKPFEALDRAQDNRYAGFEPRFAILALPNGTILASSDPRRFPVESAMPDELRGRFPAGREGLEIDPDTDRAAFSWLSSTCIRFPLPTREEGPGDTDPPYPVVSSQVSLEVR